MDKVILVVGGTGMLGAPVAQELHAAGYRVRIITRNLAQAQTRYGPEYEVVYGDVAQPSTLQSWLSGCYGVHINLSGGPRPEDYERIEFEGTVNVVNAAVMAGVKRLTYISGTSVSEANAWFPPVQAKFKAEMAIQASGIAYTIFRPSWFMESLPLFVRGKRAMLIGKQPSPVHWVAARDYARMVVKAYALPETERKTLYVYGPDALPMPDALKQYCSLVQPAATVSSLPVWLAILIARLSFNAKLEDVARLMGYFEQFTESQDPAEANRLLGAPATTLRQWCEEQRLSK